MKNTIVMLMYLLTIGCGTEKVTLNSGTNGQNGADGENGINASMIVFELTTDCLELGDGFWAKKVGSNGNLYTAAGCSNDDKVASLGENADEVYITESDIFLLEKSPDLKLFRISF